MPPGHTFVPGQLLRLYAGASLGDVSHAHLYSAQAGLSFRACGAPAGSPYTIKWLRTCPSAAHDTTVVLFEPGKMRAWNTLLWCLRRQPGRTGAQPPVAMHARLPAELDGRLRTLHLHA